MRSILDLLSICRSSSRSARPAPRRPGGARFIGAGAAVVLACLAPLAAAVTPVILVDDELSESSVKLTDLTGGVMSYFDRQRQLRQSPIDRLVQLRVVDEDAAGPDVLDEPIAMLVLVDGQRLAGQWDGVDDEGQTLRWTSTHFGRLSVPLEDVVELTLRIDEAAAGRGGDELDGEDVVTLVNGDEVRGFVTGLAPDAVVLMPTGADETIRLPMARVAGVRVANPAEPRAAGMQTVTLKDGSIVHGRSLDLAGRRLKLDAALPGRPMRPIDLAFERVARIDFTANGLALIPFADLPRRVVDGGAVFGYVIPTRVVGEDLLLHAPITLDLEAPPTAARLALTAELDLAGTPAGVHDWADCELIIYRTPDDDAPVRHRLNSAQPQVDINLPITGPTIRIELDAAVNGPILDRVRLRRIRLLNIDPAPVETSDATHL